MKTAKVLSKTWGFLGEHIEEEIFQPIRKMMNANGELLDRNQHTNIKEEESAKNSW